MPTIFIGLGTNVDKATSAVEGVNALLTIFRQIQVSDLYESQAIGFDGDNFYNAVISAVTDMSLAMVLKQLKEIEVRYAYPAQQSGMCSKRLDLDLLLYGDIISATPVVLPRPEILYNAYVLLPLSQVAPELKHPLTGMTYKELWQQFEDKSQQLWRVENVANNKEWYL